MVTFRFLDFPVYKEAKLFYKEVIVLTKIFNREYWELGDQIRRSSLSVCLNLAEGAGKRSDKDFNRYVENALGSINETIAGLDISYDEDLISDAQLQTYLEKGESITRQLGGLSRSLLYKK